MTVLFIFSFSISVSAQELAKRTVQSKNPVPSVVFRITSSNNNVKKNIFDSDLLPKISKLEHLSRMSVQNVDNTAINLVVEFHFGDVDSFYRWYSDPKIKALLEQIKKYGPNLRAELIYQKTK